LTIVNRDQGAPSASATTPPLTDLAYSALEEMIVRLELAPGMVVTETLLSDRVGIGRTPIREALQRLAREKLIRILPRKGIVVAEIDPEAQLRLLELRREVERLVARSAAQRSNDVQRARFRELALGFEKAAAGNDDVVFMRTDKAFNDLCLEAARNEFAASALANLQSLARRFWYHHHRQTADMPEAARLHAAVARAIADGDPTAAGEALDALLDNIERFTRAAAADVDVDVDGTAPPAPVA
jgi:DNA-binding GntR family transcriptional regulator